MTLIPLIPLVEGAANDAAPVNENLQKLAAAIEGIGGASAGTDAYQAGVVTPADWALSSAAVNGATGALHLSFPGEDDAWLPGPAGGLVRTFVAIAEYGGLIPPVLPGPGGFVCVGVELTASGASAVPSVVSGAEQVTEAAAIAAPPAISSGKMRVRDIVVKNTAGTYSIVKERDRRPWALGVSAVLTPPAGAAYELSTEPALVVVDATNLQARIECSGAPLTLAFSGSVSTTSTSWTINFLIDGAQVKPQSGRQMPLGASPGTYNHFESSFTFTPSAGSHLFAPAISQVGGTTKIKRTTEEVPVFTLFERRPSGTNGIA